MLVAYQVDAVRNGRAERVINTMREMLVQVEVVGQQKIRKVRLLHRIVVFLRLACIPAKYTTHISRIVLTILGSNSFSKNKSKTTVITAKEICLVRIKIIKPNK